MKRALGPARVPGSFGFGNLQVQPRDQQVYVEDLRVVPTDPKEIAAEAILAIAVVTDAACSLEDGFS
jgi:hypothetical protein